VLNDERDTLLVAEELKVLDEDDVFLLNTVFPLRL
jgi:hypothetical protein